MHLILTCIQVGNRTLNLQEYFPDIHLTDENRFIRLFSEIAHRTLDLVAKWQGKWLLAVPALPMVQGRRRRPPLRPPKATLEDARRGCQVQECSRRIVESRTLKMNLVGVINCTICFEKL